MAVKRTVASKANIAPKKEVSEKAPKEAKIAVENQEVQDTGEDGKQSFPADKKTASRTKRYCNYCVNKMEPHYWDVNGLRRSVNDRGRIIQRSRLGTCSKHQRRVGREVKRARHLALLPFASRI